MSKYVTIKLLNLKTKNLESSQNILTLCLEGKTTQITVDFSTEDKTTEDKIIEDFSTEAMETRRK